MSEKKSWEAIQREYPEQWVSLCDIERDASGAIKSGVVVNAGSDLGVLVQAAKEKDFSSHQFKYTGMIKNFLGFAEWTIEDAATH